MGKKYKEKSVDEFRKERSKKAKGHPRHFYKKKGKKYYGIGITHAPKTDGKKNLPLSKNPDPKDKKPAFIRQEVEEINESALSERLMAWGFGNEDIQMVKRLEAELEEKRKVEERKKKKKRGRKKRT